jgi:lipopolysaccharide heptosyltransferase II
VSKQAWNRADIVLCVRLDTIGDVLMTTPAVRALKEARLGRRILFLTSSAGAEAAMLVPEIDEVLVYDAPWMKASPRRTSSEPDVKFLERLRESGIDGAVIFTVYSQNPLPAALMCYLAGIKLRLAYCRENPYHLLTDWVAEVEPEKLLRHEVRRQLDLVRTIGCRTGNEALSVRIGDRAFSSVTGLLSELNISGDHPLAVIHAGATARSRRYPPESFAELADHLVKDLGIKVVFTGTRPELSLVETIRQSMNAESTSLVGRLNLEELGALLSFAALLISNNTGPAHMAAATGTPVVSLYAQTNPQHVPWNVPSRVLYHDVSCKYCYKSICPLEHNDCLRLLSPREVFSAVSDLLRETEKLRSVGRF